MSFITSNAVQGLRIFFIYSAWMMMTYSDMAVLFYNKTDSFLRFSPNSLPNQWKENALLYFIWNSVQSPPHLLTLTSSTLIPSNTTSVSPVTHHSEQQFSLPSFLHSFVHPAVGSIQVLLIYWVQKWETHTRESDLGFIWYKALHQKRWVVGPF